MDITIDQNDPMKSVFDDGGLLSKQLGSMYQVRHGQLEMARSWSRAIKNGESLLAEGPTGVGKSFAYLIPSIYQICTIDKSQAFEGWSENNQAVVSTANIALQEQLVKKDLPTLQEILPWKFDFGLLKGRSNYVCRAKMEGGEFKNCVVKDQQAKRDIFEWYQETLEGDRSELNFNPGFVWSFASSGVDDCLGRKCPYGKECFANIARREATKKDIVVTNYHIMLKASAVLSNFRVLVCDESHAMAGIARSALGWEITHGSFQHLSRWVGRHDEKIASALTKYADHIYGNIEKHMGNRKTVRLHDWKSQIGVPVKGVLDTLSKCMGVAEDAQSATSDIMQEAKIKKVIKQIANMQVRIEGVAEGKPDDWVSWVQDNNVRGASISSAPVVLDELLPAHMFERAQCTLLTSATMTSGNSFEFIKNEVGLFNAGEMIAPSPFDLRRQGIIVVPKELPDPPKGRDRDGEMAWLDAVAEYSYDLIKMCEGRCLLLFTSWKTLNYVYDVISGLKLPYHIYKQGDLPPAKLIKAFKDEVDSVLLGVASFWEGVDVPGEALTGLLIDKVPFPVPVDPINEAVGEWVERNGGSAFFDFSVPKATIALCQGVGRLIRTKDDKGVVVITDRRLIDKGYGERIIRSLPPFFKTQRIEDAERVIHGTRL